MSHNFVAYERTLIVSVSAKYFAERLSYISRAEQTLCGHKFKDDREVETFVT